MYDGANHLTTTASATAPPFPKAVAVAPHLSRSRSVRSTLRRPDQPEDATPPARAAAAASTDIQPRYAWVVMGNLWGMDLVNTFVFISIGVLIPIWREDLGMTPLQAGLMGSAGFMGFGLMALPASIWLTRYNPRLVTLLSALGMGAAALLHVIAPTVEVLLAARFCFVVLAVCRIQMQVIFIQQWFRARLYAVVNGLDFGNRSIGQMAGTMVTPVLVSLLGGWRQVHLVMAVAIVALSAVWLFAGRERRRTQAEGGPAPQVGNPAGVLKRHKVLWLVAGCQMGAAVAFASFITFYPTYALEKLNISLTAAGLLMAAFSMGGIVGSVFAGALSELIGRRKPFIWVPGLVLPAAYLALLMMDSFAPAFLLLFLAGMCAMAVPPILATIPLDMQLPPREVAVALGLVRTLFPIGATIGPLLVGLLQEITNSWFVGLCVVSPMALTLLIGGRFLPETGGRGRAR